MKNFTKDEFSNFDEMNYGFVSYLDVARSIAETPFVLTSTFRTPEENAKVGGKPDSAHLDGYAADIAVSGSRARFEIIVGLILANLVKYSDVTVDEALAMKEIITQEGVGINRIGIGSDFIHVDCDPTKDPEVVWLYDK